MTPKSTRKRRQNQAETEEESGFLSDGYDADFYGDAADRAYLAGLTEVQREAILYERAQARQARTERRILEQKLREREAPPAAKIKKTETDLKRERLEQLRAKRAGRPVQSEEEGEASQDEFDESEEEEDYYQKKTKKKPVLSKKKRRDSSDEDYYTEEEEDSVLVRSQESITERDERDDLPLDLEYANKLRLSRDILAQWIYRDGLEDLVQKCLLRVNIGAGRDGQPCYRIVEVKRFVPYHRTYLLKPGTPTNLAVLARIARSERTFRLEFCSNSPFTQAEFDYWKADHERAGCKLPYSSIGAARRKIAKLKAFHAEPLTDALIAGMIARRKELMEAAAAPRNILAEQTILQQQLREAREQGNADEEARIEAELSGLMERKLHQQQLQQSTDRLAVMDDLNRRNRLANLETGRQAEINAAGGAGASSSGGATLDPFQRRKCKPQIIGDVDDGPVVKATPVVVSVVEEKSDLKEKKSQETTDLYAAHNFDLDLDI